MRVWVGGESDYEETAPEQGKLPAPLLEAVASPAGGRVVLVLGAGCSHEAPTALPLADQLARRCYGELVADGVLAADACEDGTDLATLAEVVWQTTGGHAELVQRFPRDLFEVAEPNDGYRIAAALMLERAIPTVLTLNFDRAAVAALSSVSARNEVTVIDGPDDFQRLGATNLVFLHGSIVRAPDDLILRAEQFDAAEDQWQGLAVPRLLGGTVTVFVGLGSPTGVLVKTAQKIRALLGPDARIYIVDPADPKESRFLSELELRPEAYIRLGWGVFAEKLADRVLLAHADHFATACNAMITENGWVPENIAGMCEQLTYLGVLGLGALRARWLMRTHSYAPYPRDQETLRLLADLVIGLAMISRLSGCSVHFEADGVVTLETPDGVPARLIVLSGGGSRRWEAMQNQIEIRARSLERQGRRPRAALLAGVVGPRQRSETPDSIVYGQDEPDNIVAGRRICPIMVDEIRDDPSLVGRLVG